MKYFEAKPYIKMAYDVAFGCLYYVLPRHF